MQSSTYLPTALEVVSGHDLHGRRAIVTGGAAGIGAETVCALATAGARVIIGARNFDRAESVARALRADTGNSEIIVFELDLASLHSVQSFVNRFLEAEGPLDMLINNAGVTLKTITRTLDGFEGNFGINHLGHFALTIGLLPALRAAGNARIVSLSSIAHRHSEICFDDPNYLRRPYQQTVAYGQSKTATALFGVGFMQRHCQEGLTANAVNPGAILTSIRGLSREELQNQGYLDAAGHPHPEVRSAEQGAATSVWAAVTPKLEGIGGRYLEDCAIAGEMDEVDPKGRRWPPGYRPHALDPENANRLWWLSKKLTE